ncbi:MAG: deoxyribonuclease IV [Deltaproteobacteria bacterium]|jgi:deoxyribonuclease-4
MDWLGAHISIAGGLHNAIDRGIKAGCGVIQIFTQNANQWKGKPVSDAEAALFREKCHGSGLHEVISHDIYLVNLAAPDGETRDKSLAAFQAEMERCERLGIKRVIMHPGAHVGDGEEEGLRRVAAAFDLLFSRVELFTGKILLETTAGQGTNLGFRFEHLREIIDRSAYPDRFGVCLDTCHIFAAGYDITTETGYQQVFSEFDRIVGLERLQAFHLNDSKKGLNSHVDRHEHIGKGCLGLSGFKFLMNDRRFDQIPKILETPKGDSEEMDTINLKILRDLVE